MKLVNLTKKAIGDGRLQLSTDGRYITNGHWAIKRDLLKQAALLTSVEAAQALFPRAEVCSITPEKMKQVRPCFANPVTYQRTDWVRVQELHDAVLFVGDDNNTSQTWINRIYVKMFDLETFTSEAAVGEVNLTPGMIGESNGWDLLIMPCRAEYQKGLR